MEKMVTLWVRVTHDGRIVYSAYKKSLLDNFKPAYPSGEKYYDVLLEGAYEDEEEVTIV